MTIEHFDRIGQRLQVGDFVVYSESDKSGLEVGEVIKLTPQQVRIKSFFYGNPCKYSYDLFKVSPDVIRAWVDNGQKPLEKPEQGEEE